MFKYTLISIILFIFTTVNAQSTKVKIITNYGTMTAMLYDDTPKHRDNFLELAKKKHFDGTLFYRSVKNFVIQGGSSDSRNAPEGKHIGYGDEPVNIDAEFSKNHFHQFGALCAPRQPDKVNIFKLSDISQFYIVVGQVYPDSILDKIERATNNPIKRALREEYYVPRKEELAYLKENDPKAYNALVREIKDKLAFEYSISNKKEFTQAQRDAYTTVGGCPDLDGEYTVFGQIIEGKDVIRKINNIPVDKNDRPTKDVTIKIEIIDE